MRNKAILAFAAEAVVLGFAKSLYGAEISTLDFGLVPVDVAKTIVGIGEGSGDSAVIIHAWRRADSVTVLIRPNMQVHCSRFDTTGSKETPVVQGDKLNEHELGSVGGLVALDRRLAQVLVGVFVFVREDGDFRRHAVFHCIEFGFRFAFFGLRAGGLLCVPAVCFDLFLRSHPDCRVQAG